MEEEAQNKTKKALNFKQFISGSILAQDAIKKHVWYILFVVFLAVIYINNKYKTEKIMIDIISLQKEVKELRDRSTTYASDLMSISRESEVIRMVDEKKVGLYELKMPPEKIVIKKEK